MDLGIREAFNYSDVVEGFTLFVSTPIQYFPGSWKASLILAFVQFPELLTEPLTVNALALFRLFLASFFGLVLSRL